MTIINNSCKGDNGWIKAPFKNFPSYRFLHSYLRVKVVDSAEGIITPLEGKYASELFRVPRKNLQGNLVLPNTNMLIRANAKEGILQIEDCSREYQVKISPDLTDTPLYVGLPDYPHSAKIPSKYLDEKRGGSKFATTWFPLYDNSGKFKNQYLHYGKYSEGCITFIDKGKFWNELYLLLLKNRSRKANILAEIQT